MSLMQECLKVAIAVSSHITVTLQAILGISVEETNETPDEGVIDTIIVRAKADAAALLDTMHT